MTYPPQGTNISLNRINNLNTVGNGLGIEVASTGTNNIDILTSSTPILSYLPLKNGLFMVVINITCGSNTTLSALTVTYTDGGILSGATQTLATSLAFTAGTSGSYIALCNATTSSSISIQGTALLSGDLDATCAIFSL